MRTQSIGKQAPKRAGTKSSTVGIGFVGAGNYAKSVLLPLLAKSGDVRLVSVATATGPSAARTGERFGFEECGTDYDRVIEHDEVDLVFIATRHDSHAALAEAALRAGKHVWLEKPVGLSRSEVERVVSAARESTGLLMVGHNRRFSSHAVAIQGAFGGRSGPMAIQYVVAAGPTPSGTWLTDPAVGGGRIVGEASHFVDLSNFVMGALPSRSEITEIGRDVDRDDSAVLSLGYSDGSVSTISYLAGASDQLPKERFEVHADGKSALCDNYRSTILPGGDRVRGVNQDKGQAAALQATLAAIRNGAPMPMTIAEIESAALCTLGFAAGNGGIAGDDG